jgi:PAS domain S-box-containing protein
MADKQEAIDFAAWSTRIRRTIIRLAGALSALVGIAVPALVFFLGVVDAGADLEQQVKRQAATISKFIYINPYFWDLEQVSLSELLRPDLDNHHGMRARIATTDGKTVLDLATAASSPSVSRTWPVLDGGRIVGTLHTSVSLGSVIARTELVALGSIPLGVALFLIVWLWPNRIYRFAFERLQEMDRMVLRTANDLNKAQEIARMGSWDLDLKTDRRRWSESGLRVFGYADGELERDAADWHGLVHPDDLAAVRATYQRNITTGQPQKLQYRLRLGDEREVIIEEQLEASLARDGRLVAQTGVVQDVTDRQSLQNQFMQSQKMEAVGQLTGGVAHDFNNMLGVVIGNLDLVPEPPATNPETYKLVETATNSALKGAELVTRLLAFSRRQVLRSVVIDINQRLPAIADLLKRTLGENILVTTAPGVEIWPVQVDPVQLDSVILNLAINARDAMPQGGVLIVETGNTHLDADYVAKNQDVVAGDYAVISVSDNGQGMSPDIQERVFEPFFTTKDIGKGTGLGLSMVYGFVKQSGGHVKIYSELGRGTTVKVYLPRVEGQPVALSRDPPVAEMPRGGELILLVEDNAEMRGTAERQLVDRGYRVETAVDGVDALERLESGLRPDLLFTDVMMPGGMNGVDLAAEARKRQPGIKVLFTSGFTELSVASGHDFGKVEPLLEKPYRQHELAEMVRHVLDDAA